MMGKVRYRLSRGLVRELLHLPDDARLAAIDGGMGAWVEVVVEHPELPEVGRGEPLPVEQPALLRDGDGRLSRIVWGFEDEPGRQD